jgi:hypothetical protein
MAVLEDNESRKRLVQISDHYFDILSILRSSSLGLVMSCQTGFLFCLDYERAILTKGRIEYDNTRSERTAEAEGRP